MRLATLAGLVALAPLAAAGTAEDPEASDAPGDALVPGCFDLLAVWVAVDAEGAILLEAHVADCPDRPLLDGTYWNLDFETPRGAFFTYNYFDATTGTFRNYRGSMNGTMPADDKGEGTFVYAPGAPARITVPFPPEVERLAPEEELSLVRLRTGVYSSQTFVWDEAQATRTYAAPGPSVANATTSAPAPEAPDEVADDKPAEAAPVTAANLDEPVQRQTPAAGALLALAALASAARGQSTHQTKHRPPRGRTLRARPPARAESNPP